MADDIQRRDRVKQVFQGTLEQPADERERFVRRACGDDRELQEEVESLLRAHAAAGNFAQGPAIGALARAQWSQPQNGSSAIGASSVDGISDPRAAGSRAPHRR